MDRLTPVPASVVDASGSSRGLDNDRRGLYSPSVGTRPGAAELRRILEEAPSMTAAAQQLGISRPTLYRWMRDAGITDFRRRVRVP
jgi:transcriptional regulator of acetoin/glycerol metabolism